MYTLDTNAIIYYLKDEPRAVRVLRDIFKQNIPIYISTITEVELFGFPNLSPLEEYQIDQLLGTMSLIPVDSRIARLAGFLRREYRLKISDSVIAATARFTGSTLVTRNLRDFQRVPTLSLEKI